jgi:tetratricopeptide (TPR) repeat protein
MERTDAVSATYSYRVFREAHPELDTREGVEFIGYQIVKMGDFKAAIDLLRANAADYPRSASAQYALGRAYKAAGNPALARESFEKALQIDPTFHKARDAMTAGR